MPIHDRVYARMGDRDARTRTPAFLAIARYASRYIRKSKMFWFFACAGWVVPLIFSFGIYSAAESAHADFRVRNLASRFFDVEALASMPVPEYRAFAAKWAMALLQLQALALSFLAALSGGGAIAEDSRRHAFELYFSRPVTAWSYVIGKWFHVFTRLLLVLLWPTTFVFLIAFIFLPGFTQACWPVCLQNAGAACFMAACYALMVLGVSASVRTTRYAVVFWFILAIATIVAGLVLAGMTKETRFEAVSFRFTIEHIASAILGAELAAPSFIEVSDRSLPLSAAVLAGWMGLAGFLLVRRVRAGARS